MRRPSESATGWPTGCSASYFSLSSSSLSFWLAARSAACSLSSGAFFLNLSRKPMASLLDSSEWGTAAPVWFHTLLRDFDHVCASTRRDRGRSDRVRQVVPGGGARAANG